MLEPGAAASPARHPRRDGAGRPDGTRRRGRPDGTRTSNRPRPGEALQEAVVRRDRPAPSEQDSRPRQLVALVVDDEPAIGSLIRQLLARDGWRSIVAADAESALSEIDGIGIDLLVTDFELPGMSGLTLVARLRELDPNLPIIVVSGWRDAGEVVQGPRLAFVPKPIDLVEFRNYVRTLAS